MYKILYSFYQIFTGINFTAGKPVRYTLEFSFANRNLFY